MENLIFTRSTTIISIVLALLTGAGIIISPENITLISVIALIFIVSVITWEKFSQIEFNKRNINELNKRLDIETRFNNIELRLSKMEKK
ncbi:hypothetical protein J4476_02160 [Candidatus Woesearchaeota archaeon]|nr:MAG: hypothetical protein QT09_C0015G0021 [archaeon GW2011_AR18]MBS3161476.1 hypothetical protein [Candidatus Woesearchaeota archaeon]HIH25816.1 hypothetical protein [Nanoarchaeota archaeon]